MDVGIFMWLCGRLPVEIVVMIDEELCAAYRVEVIGEISSMIEEHVVRSDTDMFSIEGRAFIAIDYCEKCGGYTDKDIYCFIKRWYCDYPCPNLECKC
nr:hypothetical protein K-LCC10_0220 [Kaumoebavirus]